MNPEADKTTLKWQADWRTTLFTLLLLPIMVSLGFWQLERAQEKREIANRYERHQREAPVPLGDMRGNSEQLAYRKVTLQGSFLTAKDFLLDNRISRGRYGFELISTLQLADSGALVLVNRGWIAGDPARRWVPTIPPLAGELTLEGTIYVPSDTPFTLGGPVAQEPGLSWPRQLLVLDVPVMADMIGNMLYPYIVRLKAGSVSSLEIDWPLVNVSPEKHTAYAVQWFAMALALLALYLWRSSNVALWLRDKRGGEIRKSEGHKGRETDKRG